MNSMKSESPVPILWKIGKVAYECPVLPDPCPFCGKACITILPPPLAAQQSDGTTHVCHPATGGCNYGFEKAKPYEKAKKV